jgi:chemotaxis protein histidine kinase CheA
VSLSNLRAVRITGTNPHDNAAVHREPVDIVRASRHTISERRPATTPDPPINRNADLMGLYIDEALGRVAAIIAALTVRAIPAEAEIDWAALPAHSLKGIAAQAGDLPLADEVHAIETELEALRTLPDAARTEAAAAVVDRLRVVQRELEDRVVPGLVRDVPLEQIAGEATDEVRRVAARRGVAVAVDLVVPADVRISRRLAGVLLDALGHVARNAVTHGTPRGGTIRMVFEPGPESLVVIVSDRGSTDAGTTRGPDLDSGRGVGLRAAHGRLMAIGGDLSVASGAWGGTSVTLRLPV